MIYSTLSDFSFHYNISFTPIKYLGERLIQFATENLVTEVLIHPQVNKDPDLDSISDPVLDFYGTWTKLEGGLDGI